MLGRGTWSKAKICGSSQLLMNLFVFFVSQSVKESRNPKFPKGTYVDANVGWRTHTVTSDESQLRKFPPFGELPLSYAVGALGMPG